MSVLGMVSSVAGLVKVRYLFDKAVIDNLAFRTHYRVTSAIFFTSCILITANNLIGEYDFIFSFSNEENSDDEIRERERCFACSKKKKQQKNSHLSIIYLALTSRILKHGS